jgi:ribosome-associated toxin RatA of RatAB toxin-antitoxin module
MFDLVNDVDNYQNFLPWCGGSEVLEQSAEANVASVTIAFKGIHKTFTTANILTRPTEIKLAMVDGPFSKLEGTWTFKALDENACKLSLDLDFDFSNRIVGAVIGPVFKIIADSMIDSFCKRAEQVYGRSTAGLSS